MAEMWEAGDEVRTTMRDLIAKYHPDLALFEDEIAVIFKEKGGEVAEVKILGKSAKASPLLALLSGGKKWKFVITLGADGWQELSPTQQVALIDHHLCALRVEENTETGTKKFMIAPPDVAFYKDEIERHGMWRTSGAPPTQSLVDNIFGDTTPPPTSAKPAPKARKSP